MYHLNISLYFFLLNCANFIQWFRLYVCTHTVVMRFRSRVNGVCTYNCCKTCHRSRERVIVSTSGEAA